MSIQDFQASRISQWHQQQLRTHIEHSQISPNALSPPEQFRKLKHIPMAKLSLNSIFLNIEINREREKSPSGKSPEKQSTASKERQRYFCKQDLAQQKVKSQHNYYYEIRQHFQEDISAFAKKYKSLQSMQQCDDPQPQSILNKTSQPAIARQGSGQDQQRLRYLQESKRRQTSDVIQLTNSPTRSSRKGTEGGYSFNNWRSYEGYWCVKAVNCNIVREESEGNLLGHLVYAVIDMDFQRGLRIIDKLGEMAVVRDREGIGKAWKEIKVDSKDKSPKTLPRHTNPKPTPNPLNLYLPSLRIILKSLHTLCFVIKLTDELNTNTELTDTFFNREQMGMCEDHYIKDPKVKINILNLNVDEQGEVREEIWEWWDGKDEVVEKKKFDKKPSYNLGGNSERNEQKKIMKSTQNLMNYKNIPKKPKSIQQLKNFLQLPPSYQKMCIMNNLMFIINFTKKLKISSCPNDYLKLLFCFLKNGQDQYFSIDTSVKQPYMRFSEEDSIRVESPHHDEDCSNMSQSSVIQGGEVDLEQEVDFGVLLIELKNIKIWDRINFATRLLPKAKKISFIHQLQKRIVKFASLDNLLLFSKFYKQQLSKSLQDLALQHIRQQKQKQQQLKKPRKNSIDPYPKHSSHKELQLQKQRLKNSIRNTQDERQRLAKGLKKICQNYIDEYGDLATVAYLSSEYPCLQKFYQCYRQSLLLSFQQQQVQKLDILKQSTLPQLPHTLCCRRHTPFLTLINFRQQKLLQQPHQQPQLQHRKCQICHLKFLNDKRDCYIQCSKCKHGGHFQHVISWYGCYQNCPNVNCACVCN